MRLSLLILIMPLMAILSCDRDKKTDNTTLRSALMIPIPDNLPEKEAEANDKIKAEQASSLEGKTSNEVQANILPKRILSRRKSPSFEVASAQFGKFLKSSGCIGKLLSAIKAEFGEPESVNSISYRFDAGFGGWEWMLSHDGEKIVGYTREGIN